MWWKNEFGRWINTEEKWIHKLLIKGFNHE